MLSDKNVCVNGELGRMWKEMVMIYFCGGTHENHGKCNSGWVASVLVFQSVSKESCA
jgi:hypothetical protein